MHTLNQQYVLWYNDNLDAEGPAGDFRAVYVFSDDPLKFDYTSGNRRAIAHIMNQGTADAGSFWVRMELTSRSQPGTGHAKQQVPGLAANQSLPVEIPLADFQGIQFKISEMATQVEAGRLLTWRAAAFADAGRKITVEASMAPASPTFAVSSSSVISSVFRVRSATGTPDNA